MFGSLWKFSVENCRNVQINFVNSHLQCCTFQAQFRLYSKYEYFTNIPKFSDRFQ